LYRHLSESGVPVQIYDSFAFAIVRFFEGYRLSPLTCGSGPFFFLGANCLTLHLLHFISCNVLAASSRIDHGERCLTAIADIYMARCRSEFPPPVSRRMSCGTPFKIDFLLREKHDTLRAPPRDLNAQPRQDLAITTSGFDAHRITGQLASCFALTPRHIEELAVSLSHFLGELTSIEGGNVHLLVSRHNLQFATNLVWDGHKGYARCVPKCQVVDVQHYLSGQIYRPLQFSCSGRA